MISLSLISEKDVINIVTGQNIGRVDDIEFGRKTARVEYLVIFGRPRFFGLLGRGEDIHIPWKDVVTVGRDTILVNNSEINQSSKKTKFSINFE